MIDNTTPELRIFMGIDGSVCIIYVAKSYLNYLREEAGYVFEEYNDYDVDGYIYNIAHYGWVEVKSDVEI